MLTQTKTTEPVTAGESKIRFAAAGPTISKFLRSDDFCQILIGPLGSSKTTSVIFKLISLWEKAPVDSDGVRRSRWAAVRNTYPDLNSTTIRDFLEMVEPLRIGTMKYGNPPTYTAKFVASDGVVTEAEVFFLAFDLPQDVKKARGLRLSGAWFNEMKELSKVNVDMVMSRVGRYRPDLYRQQPDRYWYGCLGDSNAPDADHWLAKTVSAAPKGWWFGIQPGAVIYRNGRFEINPQAENLQNLAPGYYERMLANKDEYWIRQNLGNEFVFYADGRPVHPGFSQRQHVADHELEATPGIELALGFDFGRTPAGVVMQRQPNGQWWILDEMVTVNTSARPFAKTFVRELLNARYSGFSYVATGDPSGGTGGQATDDTPFEMLAEGGIDAYPAYTNDFAVRVDVLDRLLGEMIDGKPAILVSPRCRTIIRGLAGAYSFKRVQVSGMDRYHDKPDKTPESHVCFVAGTMIETPEGPKRVESLRVTDRVVTPLGPKAVTFTANRIAPVVDAGFAVGTPDHPVWTQRGYIPIDALQYGDVLADKGMRWKLHWKLSRLLDRQSIRFMSLMALVTTASRRVTTRLTRKASSSTFIGRFGLPIMARYRKAITFITRTVTGATTTLTTLSAYAGASILASTCESLLTSSGQDETCSMSFTRQQSSGVRTTRKQRQPSGVRAWLDSGAGSNPYHQRQGSASSAVKTTRFTRSIRISRSSVISTVSRLIAVLLGLTMKHGTVSAAGRRSLPTNTTKCGSVVDAARVYTLEVADAHCYYANGILVSNCESAHYGLMGAGEGQFMLSERWSDEYRAIETEYGGFHPAHSHFE